MTKGEKFELVFKRVYLYGRFLLSCNSRSSEVFVGSSCKLKSYGGLILLLRFLHAISSVRQCTHAEFHQTPYFIMHLKFFISYVKCVYELQDIGGDLHDSTLQCALLFKANPSLMHIFRGSSSISVFTLHMFIPIENLTSIVINHQKGGDCKCI